MDDFDLVEIDLCFWLYGRRNGQRIYISHLSVMGEQCLEVWDLDRRRNCTCIVSRYNIYTSHLHLQCWIPLLKKGLQCWIQG